MFNETNINTTITSFAAPTRPYSVTYYFVPFYAILFFIGTFGNGLVFVSIFRSSRLRTVTNSYLLNIAIADFLLLLSIPFLIITILARGWIFGNILCKMYYNFIHINQYVSSLLLAALSFDRYLAVCHPVRAIQFRTRTNCALIIAGLLKRIAEISHSFRHVFFLIKGVGLSPFCFSVQHGFLPLLRLNDLSSGLAIVYKGRNIRLIFVYNNR